MAQIFKYQDGGTATQSTSPQKKYGSLTYDNITYEGSEDLINRLIEHGKKKNLTPKDAYNFDIIIDSLKNGEDLDFSSLGNGKLEGNVDFNIKDSKKKRLGKPQRGIDRFFGTLFNTDLQAIRNAVYALKDFNYNKPSSPSKNYILNDTLTAEYLKDKDNNYKLDEAGNKQWVTGANNERILNRLDLIKQLAKSSDNDTFTADGLTKQNIINWFNRLTEEKLEGIRERIMKGNWTAEDAAILDDIKIILKEQAPTTTDDNTKAKELLKEAGLPEDDPTLLDLGLTKTNKGTYSLKEELNGNDLFGGERRYINDNFLARHHKYEPLKGWFWWDGELIPSSIASNSESDFYRDLESWRNNNANNNFGTNGIKVYDGDSDPFVNYDNTFFVPGLKNSGKNMRFSVQTNKNNPDEIIYEYYDDDTERDLYGFVKGDQIKRLKYNKKTGQVQELNSLDGISTNFDPIESYIKTYSEKAPGYYEIALGSGDNTITLFRNPYDKNDTWVYKEGMEQPFKLAPQEIQELINNGVISENPELFGGTGNLNREQLSKFLSNRQNYRGRTFTGKVLDVLMPSVYNSPVLYTAAKAINPDWTVNPSELTRRLFSYTTPIVEGKPWDRTPTNIFQSPASYQTGGRINYGTVSKKEIETKKEAAKIENPEESKKINSWEDFTKDLTKADKMQIVSIVGDVASLVASIPTGGNPVAGAIGYGSSLAQFGSDVSRDGFDLGDLGGLALNLGLDTVTLLPGVGLAGKTAKLVKSLKKVAVPLKRILIGVGAANSVKGLTNILSGNGTLDDWKSLSTGLIAATGGVREIKDIRATKYKGTPSNKTSKTVEQLRNEYVDKVVKEGNLGKYNGEPTSWANSDGTVKDYNKAIKDLTESGNLKISKSLEAKWKAEAAASKATTKVSNAFSGKNNPFSKNFRWNFRNRILPEDLDLNTLSTSQLRTLYRLQNQYPHLYRQMRQQGWERLPDFSFGHPYQGSWFYRGPIGSLQEDPNKIVFKSGGKILKGKGGITPEESTNVKPETTPQSNNVTESSNNNSVVESSPTVSFGGTRSNFWNKLSSSLGPDTLYGLAEIAASQSAINKNKNYGLDYADNLAKANKRTYVQRTLSPYYQGDLDRAYQQTKESILNNKFVHSDPKLQLANALQRSEMFENWKNSNYYPAASNRMQDYRNKIDENNWFNKSNLATITDNNTRAVYTSKAAKDNVMQSYTTQSAQNLLNIIRQQKDDAVKWSAQEAKVKELLMAQNEQISFQNSLQDLFNSKGGYDQMSPEDKAMYKQNWRKYLEDKYPTEVANLQNKHSFYYKMKSGLDSSKDPRWIRLGSNVFNMKPILLNDTVDYSKSLVDVNMKKGGTIQRYRDVYEQQYLDQNKATNKALENLNNNIVRLFMKIMS